MSKKARQPEIVDHSLIDGPLAPDDIVVLRRYLGDSQEAFARRIGRHRTTISRIETSRGVIEDPLRLHVRTLWFLICVESQRASTRAALTGRPFADPPPLPRAAAA